MRELIVTQNITLDGVIDAERSWFEPSGEVGIDVSDLIAAVRGEIATTDAVLLGRVTFEQMRAFWPGQADDPTACGATWNEVRKYVVLQTLRDPGWDRTTVLRAPALDEVRTLRAGRGRDIVSTGSMTLMPELIAGGGDRWSPRRVPRCIEREESQP